MRHKTNERSFQLRQLAAVEQDPAKLLALVQEICRWFPEEEASLKRKPAMPVLPSREPSGSLRRYR